MWLTRCCCMRVLPSKLLPGWLYPPTMLHVSGPALSLCYPPCCRHHEKLMGQVLVPAAHRVSCEFEALPADAAQLRQLLGSAQT